MYRKIIQGYESQEANNAPEARRLPSKTYIERIGTLNSVEGVVSLNVNHSNVASACVDVAGMADAGSPNLILSLNEFFIGLVCSADFQSWMRSNNGGGDHVHYSVFNYWDAAHRLLAQFSLDFVNTHVVESGRDAKELDTSALEKMARVTKHCWDHFYGLMARGAKDTSTLTIVPRPLNPRVRPAAAAANATAPKRPAPESNAVRDFEQRAARPRRDVAVHQGRFKLPTAPQVDPREKGFCYIRDPNNEHPFPSDIDCCSKFVSKGRKCTAPQGRCDFRHVYRIKNHVDLIEKIGDHFLATGAGWFDYEALRYVKLDDKYKKLRGNKNGPFGASRG